MSFVSECVAFFFFITAQVSSLGSLRELTVCLLHMPMGIYHTEPRVRVLILRNHQIYHKGRFQSVRVSSEATRGFLNEICHRTVLLHQIFRNRDGESIGFAFTISGQEIFFLYLIIYNNYLNLSCAIVIV